VSAFDRALQHVRNEVDRLAGSRCAGAREDRGLVDELAQPLPLACARRRGSRGRCSTARRRSCLRQVHRRTRACGFQCGAPRGRGSRSASASRNRSSAASRPIERDERSPCRAGFTSTSFVSRRCGVRIVGDARPAQASANPAGRGSRRPRERIGRYGSASIVRRSTARPSCLAGISKVRRLNCPSSRATARLQTAGSPSSLRRRGRHPQALAQPTLVAAGHVTVARPQIGAMPSFSAYR